MTSQTIDADAFNAWEAQGWQECAEAYHRHFTSLTSRVIEPLLDLAEVGPGSRVLDVACGPGFLGAAGAERGATATGVDSAAAMVELAGRLHPRVEFIQVNAERLPFADASFDAVVGNLAILHLGRPEQAVRGFARVLSAGGMLALSTWDHPAAGRLPGIFFEAIHESDASAPADIPAGPPFFRFADETEFTRLLDEAGFSDVAVRTVAFTHRLPSADAMWDWMVEGTVRAGALVRRQPEAVAARIRAALRRLAAEYASDGGLDLPVSVKIAYGRRRR
ncbi:MAG TPA: methyltransferase domain-containing protein [Pilimelia sp.]|nr:methyltransferase domain-containing protein [Pilimelia sp.]